MAIQVKYMQVHVCGVQAKALKKEKNSSRNVLGV